MIIAAPGNSPPKTLVGKSKKAALALHFAGGLCCFVWLAHGGRFWTLYFVERLLGL